MTEDRALYVIETLKGDEENKEESNINLPIQVHDPVSTTEEDPMETVESFDENVQQASVATSFVSVNGPGGDECNQQVVPDLIANVTNPPSVLKESAVTTSSCYSCVICMEEFNGNDIRQHNACDCVMCLPCLERTLEHHESDTEIPKGQIKCPGCR